MDIDGARGQKRVSPRTETDREAARRRFQDRAMAEWVAQSPLTALAAKTPTLPQYAERLHAIASELHDRGMHDRASWVWKLYRSAAYPLPASGAQEGAAGG